MLIIILKKSGSMVSGWTIISAVKASMHIKKYFLIVILITMQMIIIIIIIVTKPLSWIGGAE
jgi:hypothetical protein